MPSCQESLPQKASIAVCVIHSKYICFKMRIDDMRDFQRSFKGLGFRESYCIRDCEMRSPGVRVISINIFHQ